MEFPNEVCWKLPVGDYEVSLLFEMLRCLIDHKEVRDMLGSSAKRYADEVLSCENIARIYSKIIN